MNTTLGVGGVTWNQKNFLADVAAMNGKLEILMVIFYCNTIN